MKKNYFIVLIAFLCLTATGFGQVKIAELTFESPGGYTTSVTEFSDGGTDYFIRTNGSNIGGAVAFSNIQGSYYFAAQDIDGEVPSPRQSLYFSGISIAGYTSLEIRMHIAEDDDGSNQDWDSPDYFHVSSQIDGNAATYENLIWVNASGGTNTEPRIDSNFDGTGEGTAITNSFTQFTKTISGSGNTIDITIDFNLDSGDEDIAIDNIEIWGVPTCTPPTDPNGTISGTTPACTNTTLTYTHGAGQPETNVQYYWQTTPSGTDMSNSTSTFSAATSGTYYVRAFNTVTSCWSTGAVSYVVTINTTPNITVQPTNQNEVIPNTATFSVSGNGTPSPTYQWQVNTGSGWNNVSTGTGGTTDTYTTPATIAAMNGYLYRCVVSNTCGSITSNSASLTLSNNAPNNVTGIQGCFTDDQVVIDWNPPVSGPTPDGYVVFMRTGGTDPTGITGNASDYNGFNTDFSVAPTASASLGKYVYKGNTTTATVSGLTENTNYSITVYAYVGETLTGWAPGGTGGSTVTNGLAQADVTNLTATPNTNQVNLTWNNPLPTACFDELIIVANQGSVTFTPSGTYAPININYSTPNTVVYATTGTVSSKAIAGLTNGLNYCFKVFVRRGSVWSEGVEVCATPVLTYCTSEGDGSDGFFTLIRNVTFNTINNDSPNTDNAYTDFTAVSTSVNLGDIYNLSARVNTDGVYTTTTMAWIDWNQDGDFNDSNEDYALGEAFNVVDGNTDGSPISVEVPVNAVLGATRMRISTIFGTTATTPCQASGFDGEVEDYTILVQQPTGAEINIKGNAISIPNGFNAPYGLNNTLYAATTLNTDGATKTFSIENIGLATLNLTGAPRVEIVGAHPSDFIVDVQPNATVASSGSTTFDIRFHPTADGTRSAIVRIENSDSNEDPYEFAIEGTGTCSASISSTILPTSGPEGTEVTITSATDLTNATATINGITMPIVSSSASELVVSVPNGASSGNINVLFDTGCSSNNAFTVIDNVISNCDTSSGATTPLDLFISEISDATSGSSSLVEIFNGTGAAINLSDYAIKIYNNGSSSQSSTNVLSGTLANNGVHVIALGTTSCDLPGNGLSITPDQTFPGVSGINFDNNSSDAIILEKISGTNQGEKDIFGVKNSNSWANGLGVGNDGVNFRRKNDAANLPTMTFALGDWNMIDWTTCNDSDYSDYGLFDFSVGVPPNVTLQPLAPVSECDLSVTLTVAGSEGAVGGNTLAYQWYYSAPGDTGWTAVPNAAPYTGFSTTTLNISNTLALDGYQYYCQIRENSVTCYQATNAVKLSVKSTSWNGSTWSNGVPDSNTIATIAGDYTTNASNGSFTACQLFVTSGNLLTIAQGYYVEVINNVEVSGDGSSLDGILIEDKGSFVQRGDGAAAGTFTLNTNGASKVNKRTAPLNNYFEYTYWSSPVLGETIGTGLAEGHPTRRYKYLGENYLDATMETNNNNATNPGQDDIDDNGDDWVFTPAGETMLPGLGYAAMHDPIGFSIVGGQYEYVFEGAFNTGDINATIYRNDSENNDNNWNFIGNPYPSAIDADLFLAANTVIAQDVEEFPTGSGTTDGAIFLWSQSTAPSGTANGNQNLNFAQSDYAIINATGETAGGDNNNDGLIDNLDRPNRFIPSGQGFFISYSNAGVVDATNGNIKSGTVSFTNSMRTTGNNNQFFRTGHSNTANRLWLNMWSDNGVRNQILVGYVPGASNELDGMYYDALKNLSTDVNAMIYTTANNSEKKLAIQGKTPNSLNLDEVIPLGFYTAIPEATLYSISVETEGMFFEDNTVYLKDNLLNIYHNLSNSHYTFTSEIGEFNNRFEIVFRTNALSVDDNLANTNQLQIIELDSDQVKFSLDSNNLTIKTVDIMDLLGRTIYRFNGTSRSETYTLSNLSSSAYMARVTLSNNQVIVKKAIKK